MWPLPLLLPRFPNLLYAIVGDGEERVAFERLTAELGLQQHVRFHGEVVHNQLLTCYQQCNLFVLPNRTVGKDFEGFGMVLLEAQACGKPVVAGASGGTVETMRIPETGRIVACDTPEPLAAVLIELLADQGLQRQMGQAARAWVEEKFDWSALARQALVLFDLQGDAKVGKPQAEAVLV